MVRPAAVVLVVALFTACSADQPAPVGPETPSLAKGGSKGGNQVAKQYIVQFADDAVPAAFEADVAALGGTIESSLDRAGIAVVTASDASFATRAERLRGVESVIPDVTLEWIDPNMRVEPLAHTGPINTHNDTFYPLQWHLDAIDAPEAWATGATGEGARVAVLDGGFWVAHPDLNDNFDVAASRSFVPGQPYNFDTGTFWHGTHVAGIIAAEDNTIGVLGVAPRATLIGVKVLHGGTGAFSWILNAIYYAATPLEEGGAGADIINMSLGAIVPEKSRDKEDRAAIKDLLRALDRAARYAWQNDVTVIAAAANNAFDFDSPELKHVAVLPAESQHVIGVSATGPVGWALGNRDFARQASYTNYGKRLVDLSAPGGDAALPGTAPCTVPIVGGTITNPCWVFDLVLSTSRGTGAGSYSWAAGTSMASPIVAGVAALIVGENGGDMKPAQVYAVLRQSAIDLGKPGYDPIYGHGWVNAYNAVTNNGPLANND